jgi:hypothetical protein
MDQLARCRRGGVPVREAVDVFRNPVHEALTEVSNFASSGVRSTLAQTSDGKDWGLRFKSGKTLASNRFANVNF